jgi:hypothetical protein
VEDEVTKDDAEKEEQVWRRPKKQGYFISKYHCELQIMSRNGDNASCLHFVSAYILQVASLTFQCMFVEESWDLGIKLGVM